MVGPGEVRNARGEAIFEDRLEGHKVKAELPTALRGNVAVEVPPLQGCGVNALVVGEPDYAVGPGCGGGGGRRLG